MYKTQPKPRIATEIYKKMLTPSIAREWQ